MGEVNTVVTTPVFRVSFPSVFKPRKNDLNGKDEFSVMALFEKGANLDALKKAAEAAIIKKWGSDQSKWPKGMKTPFRDQAEKAKDGKLPDGMAEGAIFMTFKSTNRPTVVDQNLQEILEPSKFYAGCYARASIGAYAYDQKGNRGVSFGLNHLQLVKDGEPLSGRPSVESAFTAVATDGDASSIF
jgi:hypothetical protein